jgi:hypothetical protein
MVDKRNEKQKSRGQKKKKKKNPAWSSKDHPGSAHRYIDASFPGKSRQLLPEGTAF